MHRDSAKVQLPREAMAPENTVSTWYPLRSVTQRLTATPAATLPHIIPYLVTTISGCKDILADIGSQSQKKGDQDASIVVYKLKTQISTLLQDRNKEARWAAVVLVKAIVEAGGWSVLQGSGAWVRSLLGLMGVSDRISSHQDQAIHMYFGRDRNHQPPRS